MHRDEWDDEDAEPGKGHFFSDDSALTNRPDAKTQLLLIFLRISSCFFGIFLPENYSISLE